MRKKNQNLNTNFDCIISAINLNTSEALYIFTTCTVISSTKSGIFIKEKIFTENSLTISQTQIQLRC